MFFYNTIIFNKTYIRRCSSIRNIMHSIITLYFLYDFHFCVFILKCHQFESFQNEIRIVYCIYLLKCVLFVTGNWFDIAYYEKVLKKWPMFLPTYILWMCRKTDVIYCVIYQVFLFRQSPSYIDWSYQFHSSTPHQ